MEFHPVSNIFPLLIGQEFEELKEDIKKNGLIEPIWLHPDGSIIDGRNRYRACIETDVEIRIRLYEGDLSIISLVNFVVSLNLKRRHLSSSQLAFVALEIEKVLAEAAKERQLSTLKQNQTPDVKIFPHRDEIGKARDQAANIVGTNGRYVQDAKKLAKEFPSLANRVISGELTIPQAKQELARKRIPEIAISPILPSSKYRCIVIDPPWPMKKIEREERPNQGIELDYPTLTLEEIKALPVLDLADLSGCHLYLWVTHKYLPFGLELVKDWGFKYQCLMTWCKNVGITPYSWMYDTEHVIFARCGNLPLNQLGLRLSFSASVNGHSAKPEIFFNERVILASPEPRLEMFARKTRIGFEVWGNEV